MKKFAIGIFAVAFAVIGFAFTTEKKTQTQYAWFEVQLGKSIACNNFTSVTPADLILIPRVAGQTALTSVQAAGQSLPTSSADDFFNCPATQFVCAVGYALTEANFQFVTIDGVEYVRPISTVTELDKVCRTQP